MTAYAFALFALILALGALVNALWVRGRAPAGSAKRDVATYTALVFLAIVVGTSTQLAFVGRPAAQIAGSVTSILLMALALLLRFRRSRMN